MVCIVDRLQKTLNRKISSDQIWKHLKTMYNLKALDDSEPLPFPNHEE
jgi:MRG-binding protein